MSFPSASYGFFRSVYIISHSLQIRSVVMTGLPSFIFRPVSLSSDLILEDPHRGHLAGSYNPRDVIAIYHRSLRVICLRSLSTICCISLISRNALVSKILVILPGMIHLLCVYEKTGVPVGHEKLLFFNRAILSMSILRISSFGMLLSTTNTYCSPFFLLSRSSLLFVLAQTPTMSV